MKPPVIKQSQPPSRPPQQADRPLPLAGHTTSRTAKHLARSAWNVQSHIVFPHDKTIEPCLVTAGVTGVLRDQAVICLRTLFTYVFRPHANYCVSTDDFETVYNKVVPGCFRMSKSIGRTRHQVLYKLWRSACVAGILHWTRRFIQGIRFSDPDEWLREIMDQEQRCRKDIFNRWIANVCELPQKRSAVKQAIQGESLTPCLCVWVCVLCALCVLPLSLSPQGGHQVCVCQRGGMSVCVFSRVTAY